LNPIEEKKIANNQVTRSEDVQEILSKPPSSLINWGSGSILAILILLISLSMFLKYPETISGEAKLTTSIDPSLIYNLSDGYLEKVFVGEDSIVQRGQVVGEIRSALLSENINFLDNQTSKVRTLIASKNPSIELPQTTLSFGLIQENYNNLLKLVYDYNQLNSSYHLESIQRLSSKAKSLKELSLVLTDKLDIGAKELENAKVQYQIDERLYKENVIAKSDWIEKTTKYHQKLNEFQNLKQSFLQNELQIKETEGQVLDLKYKNDEAKNKNMKEIEVALTSIENYKQDWKQKYTLIAPISGRINFIKKISSGDFLKVNQPVAYIIPQSRDIRAKIKVPYKGFAKIKSGQKARITLDSYPYQEFGYITGSVIKTAEAPSEDNSYEVIVELPDDLISSFKHRLTYKPNSKGFAEVITQDYSLFERLIFSSRNTFTTLKRNESQGKEGGNH
jgi:multidrug resistance efflux pump